MPRQNQKRSDKINTTTNNNGKHCQNQKRKAKRRRLDIKPSSRWRRVIREAHVNQGDNERGYISENEQEQEEMEYLPRRARRSGVVVQLSLRRRHEIPHPQPQDGAKNIASSSIKAPTVVVVVCTFDVDLVVVLVRDAIASIVGSWRWKPEDFLEIVYNMRGPLPSLSLLNR